MKATSIKCIRPACGVVLCMTLLLGIAYPLLVTAVAQMLFHHKANGSVVENNGKVIGSALLGQSFNGAGYFWGRPSATTPPYNASASSGSNLSPANPKTIELANSRAEQLRKAHNNKLLVPIDLVTASASGLDPHIKVQAAKYQAARIAKARKIKEEVILSLIDERSEKAEFGLKEPYVNVLLLNLALDNMSASKK